MSPHFGNMRKRIFALFLPMLDIASAVDRIQINPDINDRVTIEIPYGESYTFVNKLPSPPGFLLDQEDARIHKGDQSRFFHGTSEDSLSTLNMVKYTGENDKYVGSIVDGNKNTILQFSPGLDGEIEFVEFDAGDISPEIGLSEVPDDELDSNSNARLAPDDIFGDDGSVLDIMVLWTKKAECSQSGLPKGCTLTSTTETNMRNLIDLAVFETNVAYANSGIETELRLVHAYRHPDFDEDDDSYYNAIYQLQRTNDGILDDVHDLRETHKADLVAMLIDRYTYCGIAFIGARKSVMFSITSYFCATGTYTFGHEVGHNLGLRHDRGADSRCSDGTFNFGWRDPEARFRTVMAYNCASGQCDNNPGGGCSRIQHFSSSTVTYDGLPTGDSENDAARVINEVKATVAAYYQSEPPSTPFPTASPTRLPTPSPTMIAPNPAPTRAPITGPPVTEPTSSPNTFQPNYDEWLIYGMNAVVDSFFINVSQKINSGPKAAEVTIYENDCETEVNSDDIVSLASGPIVIPSHNITYRLFMDQNKLDNSDLVTFENDSKGTISFCTKLTTKTEDLSLEVSSKKLKFNVNFDLSDATFTLEDISLGEDEAENVDLALEFTISAYECDEFYDRVENVYVQGPTAPEFRVCITPDSEDLRVSNMMLEMTGSNGFVYQPVDFGGSNGPITNEITDIEESGSTTMVITRLVSGLFGGEDSTLSVTGSCILSSQDNDSGARKNYDLLPFTLTVLLEGAEEESKEVGCLESLLARFL